MSDLERRGSGRMTRKQREQRAYALTLATGGGGLATMVAAVLGIVGITSFGLVVLLAVITIALAFALRRTLNPR